MSIEVRPLGVKCNLRCLYCYQHPQRDAGNILHSYDMKKMKEGLEKAGGSFSLFGGEALLVPEGHLEELWSWGFERYGQNGIQTNGVLINENHIRMFKKYKVSVGISVDGPGELNDARWCGTLEKTREATTKTHAAIEQLAKEKIALSLIVTLHRGNATRDKLSTMHKWLRHLDELGIKFLRLHILEVETDKIKHSLALSSEENFDAFLSFYEFGEELNTLKIEIFEDMFNMMLGQDKNVTCYWTGCDPYTTSAVQGIEGNGQQSNCTRTNKDGIDFVKSNTVGYERYLALYNTPQEYNGCQGCRFFLMCKGHCPGMAINWEWRNRTEYCEVWQKLFTHLEKRMVDRGETPLSINSDREKIEEIMLKGWSMGLRWSIADILSEAKKAGQSLASIEKILATRSFANHGNILHGDAPHGDHTDC